MRIVFHVLFTHTYRLRERAHGSKAFAIRSEFSCLSPFVLLPSAFSPLPLPPLSSFSIIFIGIVLTAPIVIPSLLALDAVYKVKLCRSWACLCQPFVLDRCLGCDPLDGVPGEELLQERAASLVECSGGMGVGIRIGIRVHVQWVISPLRKPHFQARACRNRSL